MAKRKPKPVEPAKPRVTTHFFALAIKIILALGAVVGLLFGLSYAGKYAGLRVSGDARYRVPIAEVQFEAPAYIDKAAFLTEVRYLANLPEAISSVDPNTSDILKAAFRQHPWIAEANEIIVTPEGKLLAKLIFRKPVLAIKTQGEKDVRAVDAMGVLLPESAPTDQLPVFLNLLPHTETATGQRHADPDVVRAAELVMIHPAKSIKRDGKGWEIVDPNGKLLRIATP
jgi:hypothetical protein